MDYFTFFFQPPGWQEKKFVAPDGAVLRYGHAAPPGGATRGTVILTTGFAAHIDSYYEIAQAYLDRGYAVWMMDWAGQGGSKAGPQAGRQGASAKTSFLVRDHAAHLHHFRHKVAAAGGALPPFILASHSMGGQIGLAALETYPGDFDAAVLAAPLVDFRLTGMLRGVLRGILRSAVLMGLRDASIEGGRATAQRGAVTMNRHLNRNKRARQGVRVDPHRAFLFMSRPLGSEDPTVGMVDSLFETAERMKTSDALTKVNIPVLLGAGARDQIVSNDAIVAAAGRLPQGKLCLLPKAGHSIWHEEGETRRAWWQAIDDLLARVPPSYGPRAGLARPLRRVKRKGPGR